MCVAIALLGACSTPPEKAPVVASRRDAGPAEDGGDHLPVVADCDNVTIEGDEVTVREEDVTAHFTMAPLQEHTVMMFGGDEVTFDNAVSSIGLVALDRSDALVLAEKYDDFYLCSSPGGIEAQNHIVQFDLVPANCAVYRQLVNALDDFAEAVMTGGDRVSLTFEGAKLQLLSAAFDESGQDVTDQLSNLNFHLVTKVEQITGQSLIDFGMN